MDRTNPLSPQDITHRRNRGLQHGTREKETIPDQKASRAVPSKAVLTTGRATDKEVASREMVSVTTHMAMKAR